MRRSNSVLAAVSVIVGILIGSSARLPVMSEEPDKAAAKRATIWFEEVDTIGLETIPTARRAKVPRGWLVVVESTDRSSGNIQVSGVCFIPDAGHDWQ